MLQCILDAFDYKTYRIVFSFTSWSNAGLKASLALIHNYDNFDFLKFKFRIAQKRNPLSAVQIVFSIGETFHTYTHTNTHTHTHTIFEVFFHTYTHKHTHTHTIFEVFLERGNINGHLIALGQLWKRRCQPTL